MENIKDIIIFIMGTVFGAFLNSIGKDIWDWCKTIFKLIKEYIKLFIKTKKIYNEYKNLKISNKNYKDQAQCYNIFYESSCREYYINQIKEKYGTEYCTPEMLRKYWIDDYNQWKTVTKINGDIYEITSIGLDTLNKNIWKSYGPLNNYD